MDFPTISLEDLLKAIEQRSVTLLDCNGSDHFTREHIPGAIDFAAEKDRLKLELPSNKNALIVAYCGGEQCNAYELGAKAAADLGYTNVKHFKPGIKGWVEAKQAVASLSGASRS